MAQLAPAVAPAVFVAAAHATMGSQHARKRREPIFLIVIETLVKRRAGISDFFQGGAGLGHIVGALREPLKRCHRLRLLLFASLARLRALDPQLNEIAHRLLEWRPILALIGRELQTGFQCGDARIGKGGNISNT